VPLWLWMVFTVTVLVSSAVDLLAHREAHIIGFREAAAWSGVWLGLAIVFGAVVIHTTYKVLKEEEGRRDPGKSIAVRLLRKINPAQNDYAGIRFFI
jgi:hypothetical protein